MTVIFLPLKSRGQEIRGFSIQLTLRSYHFDKDRDFNEWNIGLGVGYTLGYGGIELGTYYNSESNMSYYVTAGRSIPQDYWIGGLVSVGVVVGYERGISPMFIIGSYFNNNPRLRIGFLPNPTGSSALFSQLNYFL